MMSSILYPFIGQVCGWIGHLGRAGVARRARDRYHLRPRRPAVVDLDLLPCAHRPGAVGARSGEGVKGGCELTLGGTRRAAGLLNPRPSAGVHRGADRGPGTTVPGWRHQGSPSAVDGWASRCHRTTGASGTVERLHWGRTSRSGVDRNCAGPPVLRALGTRRARPRTEGGND